MNKKPTNLELPSNTKNNINVIRRMIIIYKLIWSVNANCFVMTCNCANVSHLMFGNSINADTQNEFIDEFIYIKLIFLEWRMSGDASKWHDLLSCILICIVLRITTNKNKPNELRILNCKFHFFGGKRIRINQTKWNWNEMQIVFFFSLHTRPHSIFLRMLCHSVRRLETLVKISD